MKPMLKKEKNAAFKEDTQIDASITSHQLSEYYWVGNFDSGQYYT